ncbi:trigger factor [bacterium]|nr:trigger factor [candidate division CSSED10-310 bacterium]
MKHSVEKISETTRTVRVEIPVDRVTSEFEKIYIDLTEKAVIPGFRKGKVPRSMLRLRMGDDIASQIGIDLIKESLPEAMKSIEEQTVGYPEFNEWKVEEGQPFIYEARIEILPPFELKDYKGIEVPKNTPDISDEEIIAGLERIRAGQTTYEVVSGRPAQKEDRIYGRITLSMDGQAVPGWTNRHIEVDLGKNSFFPDSPMEERLIGAEADKEHCFTVDFPADYTYYRDVAGKSVSVQLRLNDIKTRKMPDIDDDLAKDLGLETVDELKKMVRDDIERKRQHEIDEAFESAIIDKIESANSIPAPGPMVTSEAEFIVDNYFKYQNQLSDERKAQLMETMKPMAEKRVRQRLILQRVAELENIEVTDDDVKKAFEEMAEQEKADPEELRSQWEKDDLIDNLKRQLRRSRALDWLKQNVVPVDAPINQADDVDQKTQDESETMTESGSDE